MTRTTPNARRDATASCQPRVEDVLREIAYRLHATRKVRPEDVWPVVAQDESRGRRAARHSAAARSR